MTTPNHGIRKTVVAEGTNTPSLVPVDLKPVKTGRLGLKLTYMADADVTSALREYCYLMEQRTGRRMTHQSAVDTAVRALLKQAGLL